MSIIWCGGEELDFIKNSVNAPAFASSYSRTSYARGAIQLYAHNTPYLSNIFTSVNSNTWLHWYMQHQSGTVIDTNCFPVGLYNSVTGDAIGVNFNASDYWCISKRTAAGTITNFVEDTVAAISLNTLTSYDLHIETYGSSGAIHFYRNGNLMLTYTGDITVGSTTDFNQVQLRRINSTWGTYISEIIVADEDTRLMSLKTLAPNAAGDTNNWEGTYANIDELAYSDADTIYTDTVEEDAIFNLTGMPAGDFICKAVKIVFRGTDGVGGIGVQAGIKTNSALHLGSTITLGGVWDQYEQLYNQNPETLNRFTPAEIEALQIAFRSKSTA